MKVPELPASWNSILERIEARRSSPILMPVALLAVVHLAERRRIESGHVVWKDFESEFSQVIARYDVAKRRDAWRPFFHLSRGVGLWTLWKGDAPARFDGLPRERPTSAATLIRCVDHARLDSTMALALELPTVRSILIRRLGSMLETRAQ